MGPVARRGCKAAGMHCSMGTATKSRLREGPITQGQFSGEGMVAKFTPFSVRVCDFIQALCPCSG